MHSPLRGTFHDVLYIPSLAVSARADLPSPFGLVWSHTGLKPLHRKKKRETTSTIRPPKTTNPRRAVMRLRVSHDAHVVPSVSGTSYQATLERWAT